MQDSSQCQERSTLTRPLSPIRNGLLNSRGRTTTVLLILDPTLTWSLLVDAVPVGLKLLLSADFVLSLPCRPVAVVANGWAVAEDLLSLSCFSCCPSCCTPSALSSFSFSSDMDDESLVRSHSLLTHNCNAKPALLWHSSQTSSDLPCLLWSCK